jgi:DNA-binding FadR family transcriptional regulator
MARARRRYSPAEAVADRLRERILSGGMADGGMLPNLDALTVEFGMTKSTVRDACRILETEGLLTVRRGTGGGAVAHTPSAENAAYNVGLVLQAQQVTLPDVAIAVRRFEPLCVELCAEREDRATTVIPVLEDAQAALAMCIENGDMEGASLASRQWHEALVTHCGNATTAVILGTLEAVWGAHVRQVGREHHARGAHIDRAMSQAVHDEHQEIQHLILVGDAGAAARAARDHLTTARTYSPIDDEGSPVRAASIRDAFFG